MSDLSHAGGSDAGCSVGDSAESQSGDSDVASTDGELDSSVDGDNVSEWVEGADVVDSDDDDFVCVSTRKQRNAQLIAGAVDEDVNARISSKFNETQQETRSAAPDWCSKFWWTVGDCLMFGRPGAKGEVRKGPSQATQCYGTGTIGDNDFVKAADKRLEDIKILPAGYHWLPTPAGHVEKPQNLHAFEGDGKPTVHFPADTAADDMFLALFSDSLEEWMNATNGKASERWSRNGHSMERFKPWSRDSFLTLVATLLWMDVEPKSEIDHYWSRNNDFSSHFVRNKLSGVLGLSHRKCSEMLRSTRLYCKRDAELFGWSDKRSPTYDNQHKTRPFLDKLYKSFQKYRSAGRNLSIDESMMKFTGLCSFVQTIIRKPIKRGLKFFYLADSTDGYIYNGLLCSAEILPYRDVMGSVFAYVWNLLDDVEKRGFTSYLDKGHIIYMDRYFTSVPLLYALFHRRTYAAGTIRVDRKNVPSWNVLLEVPPSSGRTKAKVAQKKLPLKKRAKTQKKSPLHKVKAVNLISKSMLPWGAVRYRRDNVGALRYLAWRDSKVVHLLYSHPEVATETVTCSRRNKAARGSVKLQQPAVVKVFDENMGGVDICDQLIAAHRRHMRSYVWYVAVLYRGIRLACSNVYANLKQMGAKPSMKDVKILIAKGLYEKVRQRTEIRSFPRWCKSYTSFEVDVGRTGVHNKCVTTMSLDELHKIPSHFPKRYEGTTRTSCAMCCKGLRVVQYCEICKVGLHVACFHHYHVIKFYMEARTLGMFG